MAKRKKKTNSRTTPRSLPRARGGQTRPNAEVLPIPRGGQARPDAAALPQVARAMRQIDRLLALMPNTLTVETTAPQDGRELHNWDVVAPAMLFSAANCLLSLRWLATTPVPRREQDASILLRRIYEHVVAFAWIAIDPERNARRWVASDYRYRLAIDDELRALGRDGLDPAQRASFQAYIQAHGQMPSVEQRADQADAHWLPRLAHHGDGRPNAERNFSLADEYTTIYRTTSANTHPSPRSLYAYVNPGGGAGRFAIGFMPNLTEEDRYAYTFAPLTFATMLVIAQQVLGYPTSDAVFAAFNE